ncbi:MAG: electron transporter RnfE [Denitrovibrio sp.]|nr:MAG: electron transporter RnfE [Denitrovibrio sp.]
MFGYSNGYGFGCGSLTGGGFMWIFFIIIIGLLLYSFVKDKRSTKTNVTGTAMEILNERYAKGELNADEYKRMKSELNK